MFLRETDFMTFSAEGSVPFFSGMQAQIGRPAQLEPKTSPNDRPTLNLKPEIEGYGPPRDQARLACLGTSGGA